VKAACGKLARTREMVSMDMGLKDTANLPAMQTCQIQIDLWIKGGINDECLLVLTNHVGEASFPVRRTWMTCTALPAMTIEAVFHARLHAFIPPSRE
jgi:hypothetical protein